MKVVFWFDKDAEISDIGSLWPLGGWRAIASSLVEKVSIALVKALACAQPRHANGALNKNIHWARYEIRELYKV